MKYFTKDYLEFFKELAANNNKDWFDSNRKRYESVVRDPFKHFVSELIASMSKLDPAIDIDPKEAIFRINRDIRFSKDKTPYKLNNSAIISPMGRKDKNYPGLYLELGPEKLAFYGGVYMPDPKLRDKIRSFMMKNVVEFDRLIKEKDFMETFGEIRGEKSKKVPKEFSEAIRDQPLIMNKNWYYCCDLPPEQILADDLIEVILRLNQYARPLREFLTRAVS